MAHNILKKLEPPELTHSSIHYLLAINQLVNKQGYARAVDIANHLGLTRGSVSITLNKLVHKGYVQEDENKFVRLSTPGLELVNAVLSKRRLLEKFLTDILHVDADIAQKDACKVEHLFSRETSAKLLSFVRFYESDDPAAVKFSKAFSKFNHTCHQPHNDCEICETACYFIDHENLTVSSK